MPTDYELFIERHTRLSQIRSDSEAAEILAQTHGLRYDSVRGRLSRTNTPANLTKLMKTIANETPDIAPSVARQYAVLDESQRVWEELQTSGEKSLVFLSDIHFGVPRWDAYHLAMQIIQDLRPTYVTGANDLRDNRGFSRWMEDRPVRGQIWTSDDANIRQLELAHYRALHKNAIILQVQGNHDNWYYRNLRENSPQTAERDIADYMESLAELQVLQFSRGYTENYIELSKGLVIWHGQFTNKNGHTLAKSNIEHFLHVFQDGTVRSVVAGHTHRPMEVMGSAVGYPSVKYVNSGAITDYTPYMKRNPHNHGLGIVVCRFDPTLWQHTVDLITFREKGSSLEARYEGINYEVPLDVDHPNEYL